MAFASFLSTEQAQRARPLRAWSDRQIEAVRAAAQAQLVGWCTDWALDAQGVQVTVGQGDAPPSLSPEALQRALQAALFGLPGQGASPGAGGALSREVRARVWDELRARLLAWSGVDLLAPNEAAPAPPSAIPAWSGDLVLRWSWAGLHGSWRLIGDTVARLVPTSTAPAPAPSAPPLALGQALSGHTLALQARLAPVALRLGDLASLAVGDVVRLPHALDQPLHLNLPDGQGPVCAGWLGQRQGRKALDLVPVLDADAGTAH